jgi:hypothetical protein
MYAGQGRPGRTTCRRTSCKTTSRAREAQRPSRSPCATPRPSSTARTSELRD